jgi:hypothetical protein
MKTNLILSIVLGITFFACNNTSNEKSANQEQKSIVSEDNHQHGEVETIILNNGNKWMVVPDMMAFIRTMENGVNEFSKNENPTSDEYQQLAVLIDENIRKLTSNCTMEGQAHDELHKWLLPFIELSEKFDVATDINEQEDIYQEFKKSYETFNTYFE